MSRFRVHTNRVAVAVFVALAVAAGPSATYAQSSVSSKISATAEEVKNWTLKQWNAAKHEWRKDKDKWHACNAKAADKKLKGKDRWVSIYECMKS